MLIDEEVFLHPATTRGPVQQGVEWASPPESSLHSRPREEQGFEGEQPTEEKVRMCFILR